MKTAYIPLAAKDDLRCVAYLYKLLSYYKPSSIAYLPLKCLNR